MNNTINSIRQSGQPLSTDNKPNNINNSIKIPARLWQSTTHTTIWSLAPSWPASGQQQYKQQYDQSISVVSLWPPTIHPTIWSTAPVWSVSGHPQYIQQYGRQHQCGQFLATHSTPNNMINSIKQSKQPLATKPDTQPRDQQQQTVSE
jgi:hypothetical protein